MALTLPYPDLDFVPLDVLTADEMNQIVANYTYISNQFPITSENIDFTTYKTTNKYRVGTWTDGRPIYRRVFTGNVTLVGTTVYTTELIASGVDFQVASGGYVLKEGAKFSVNSVGTTDLELSRIVVVGTSLRLQTSKQAWETYAVWVDFVETS